jgi:uncharacterized protein (TIGR02118 family)
MPRICRSVSVAWPRLIVEWHHGEARLLRLPQAGLSREEFLRYWAQVHGPIGARIPGLHKLVQSHALPVAGDSRPPDFDGMAELWFDDLAAVLEARQSAEWEASTADEVNFVDPTRSAYFVSEERQIL